MYQVIIEEQFAAAHQLRDLQGQCESLHGHNWRVQVHVAAGKLGRTGIVLDFLELKRVVRSVIEPFEHTCLNQVFPFTKLNPSSENLAKWLFDALSQKLNTRRLHVSQVMVWESDTAGASYTGQPGLGKGG